jgi:Domain of unknown function (DUF1772)
MLLGQIALAVAGAFTGAAFYVSCVEQPARLELDDHALLAEWQPAYRRGTVMQASLALIGGMLGLIAWWQAELLAWPWLIGALLLLANWPYTLLVIKPVNDRLMATVPANAAPETRRLIEHWARLHLIRSVLGLGATGSFMIAMLPCLRACS